MPCSKSVPWEAQEGVSYKRRRISEDLAESLVPVDAVERGQLKTNEDLVVWSQAANGERTSTSGGCIPPTVNQITVASSVPDQNHTACYKRSNAGEALHDAVHARQIYQC
jgi:hypothetical protein